MKLQPDGWEPRVKRRTARLSPEERTPRVISLTSGKEGVGKTSILLNLGLALRQMDYRVLLIDGSMGGANLNTLFGLAPEPNLADFFQGRRKLKELLVAGPAGLQILPGVPGDVRQVPLDFSQKLGFLQELDQIGPAFDYVLLDAGAGISNNVLYFNLGATQRIIVADQEPASLVEAYSMIKFLAGRQAGKRFQFLFNKISQPRLAAAAFAQLTRIADRFLNGAVFLEYLGCIPFDQAIPAAAASNRPLLELYPRSPAGLAFLDLARQLDLEGQQHPDAGSIRFGQPRRQRQLAC